MPAHLRVPVMPVAELLETLEFQFISIDAEGMDFEILKAMRSSTLRACRLLCIEPHDLNEREQMRGWLLNAGFTTAHETPENLLVVRV